MKIELNEKELIELDRYAISVVKNDYAKLDVGKGLNLKINEILSNKLIEIKYLKVSEVKFNSREKINKIGENAVIKLINLVLEKHLERKPTDEDFKKVRFSHETDSQHSRFVYFPEGKYLGQYMNVKDDGFFKLVFRFG
jgi:hypothetical protein